MKTRRCAFVAAAVLAVCTVAFLCRNQSVPGVKGVAEESVVLARGKSSVTSVASAPTDASAAFPTSNQTATVRGTKPYVLTCEQGFTRPLRLAAEALGARTVGVLSRRSLLVEADGAALSRLAADGRFSVEREFLPSAKVSPALAEQIAGGREAVDVSLVTLAPDDRQLVKDRVIARGGEILKGCFDEGSIFRARLPATLVAELAACGDVRWMEVFVRPQVMNDIAVTNVAMNVQRAWTSLGLSGSGQFVSTSDSGIDLTHQDLVNQVSAYKVAEECVEYDGIGHGTHTAGSIAGDGTMSDGQIRGTAHGAQLYAWFCGKEGDRGIYTPATIAELFRGNAEGTEWDTYIHSASWGGAVAGEYTTDCVDIDQYVWEHPDFLPVFSAGNEGSGGGTIGSPASAKNVLAVGATQNLREEGGGRLDNGDPTLTAEYSSRGPCQDGRIKPDIAAPGTGVLSTRAYNQEYSYGVYEANTNYAFDTGTSMACPLTAGAVALVREWLLKPEQGFTDAEPPTAALMKAIVMGGAKDAARPNNEQGWGRVDLAETLKPSNRAVKLIDRIPYEAGAELSWIVTTRRDAPLDVLLAWVDHPGDPSASQLEPKLVNDLDLSVRPLQNDELLYGNGGKFPDARNNVESVRLDSAEKGRYVITVSCKDVLYDWTEGGAAALYIRGAFDSDEVEPYWNVRIVRSPSETNTYIRLDKALNEARSGDVVEILDETELRESVVLTNDLSLTVVATNANPRLSSIVRRNHAAILVRNGSLSFSNTVFRTEPTTPVRVSDLGVVRVSGTAVFDDIVSRVPGILTASPLGFELAGPLENGITVDCSGASQPGTQFGTYRCADAVAAESAPRLISTYGEHRAGVAEKPNVLKWSDEVTVDPAVAVGYVDGTEKVYYRTLDQLFDEHPNGTNVVITKSGIILGKARTLYGRQSISAEPGAGEIVIRPEGGAGFTLAAGCELELSGIAFVDYTGNCLFLVNGVGAKLDATDVVFRDIEGTNAFSGAVAVFKGAAKLTDCDFTNCRATGRHMEMTPNGTMKEVASKKACGGAIYLAGADCELELDGGTIVGCYAKTYGGGVYATGGSSVSVRGALTVDGNWSENNKSNDNIHLQNAKAAFTLAGKLDGTDAVGVRYGASGSGKGNGLGNQFAAVADGADYESSLKAFFNDTDPDGMKAVADEDGANLLWAERTPGDRNVDPGDVDATVRVTKGGVTQYYIEPEYAFEWIDADATVEVLKDAEFGGNLVVTNGVKVTLVSTNATPYMLTRLDETEIRVLAGASLTVTNVVLNGNGESSTIGLVRVENAALELQAGAVVTNVAGSADRASGAISVWNHGTFTMRSGAEICNCRNSYVNEGSKAGYGGGLLVDDHSTANLLGGSVTGCAANRGGGVFIGTESQVVISSNMTVTGNWNLSAKADNLCVADLSSLVLTNDFSGLIGYNEGRSADTNVFGRIAAGFSGDKQDAAHRFTHDVTGDIGMAVTDGSETLLVWGNALDADGKYQKGDKTYSLVNGGEPLYEIPVPDAADFTYDGTAKTCLTDGIGYRVLAGNVATNVGNYTVVVTTRAGFAWEDGTTGQKEMPWTIEAPLYELKGVTFEDTTFEYDGTMKYLALTGTLPDGLLVKYENNGRWQPGTNEVTAVISGFLPNYKPESFPISMSAKLIIVDPEGLFNGEVKPKPLPEYTVTTNTPTPIAFSEITRISDLEWRVVVTDLVEQAEYAVSCTPDLKTAFTTGTWFRATSGGAWTNTVPRTEPAYFWRAHGRTTYVTNWIEQSE